MSMLLCNRSKSYFLSNEFISEKDDRYRWNEKISIDKSIWQHKLNQKRLKEHQKKVQLEQFHILEKCFSNEYRTQDIGQLFFSFLHTYLLGFFSQTFQTKINVSLTKTDIDHSFFQRYDEYLIERKKSFFFAYILVWSVSFFFSFLYDYWHYRIFLFVIGIFLWHQTNVSWYIHNWNITGDAKLPGKMSDSIVFEEKVIES